MVMNPSGLLSPSTAEFVPENKTVPSISIIKLSSQLRKIIKELDIQENNELNYTLIINRLLENHSEYRLVTLKELQKSVQGIINNLLISVPTPGTEPSSTSSMNLNQSMINKQRSLSSKRQRPEDATQMAKNDSTASLTQLDVEAKFVDGTQGPREKRRKMMPTESDAIINPKGSKISNSFLVERPKVRFADLAGLENVLTQIKELVCYPLWYADLYSHLGVCPPCGILLHGPSGCGKTTLANAIAGETGLNYYKVKLRIEECTVKSSSSGRFLDLNWLEVHPANQRNEFEVYLKQLLQMLHQFCLSMH